MILVFLAEGFEECEALVPIDILRRANISVKTVGVGNKTIVGAHEIPVICDITDDETHTDNIEGIILPGGMPGTLNLENSEIVNKFIDYCAENDLLISAICAAPSILGHKGLLKNKKATCFTGFESELKGAKLSTNSVVSDDNIITAYGAGAAFDFGFEILSHLKGSNIATQIKKQMRY